MKTTYNSLCGKLTKMKIVDLFYYNKYTADEIAEKLDIILDDVYEDGVEMGLSQALNYVSNERDRQRLFNAIDESIERRDNEK